MNEALRRALDGEAGRAAEVRKALLVRGLAVADRMDDGPPVPEHTAAVAALAPLLAMPLSEVLARATPFFWLNLARFYDAIGGDGELPLATQRLLDSMLAPLPTAPTLPVPCAAGHVLLSADPLLVEDAYREQILVECDPRFPEHLAAALALIREADPETGERIARQILWYVPIASPDAATHCSFTSPRLHGVTFLSQSDDPLRLAEALVHEFGHTELHALMAVEPLVGSVGPEELFYSPWRPDPRPIVGLLHGLYAFSEVLSLLAALAIRVPGVEDVRPRLVVVALRLRIALAQVPRDRLDPLGRAIVDDIDGSVATWMGRFGFTMAEAPPFLHAHREKWSADHPALASRIASA